MIYYSKKKIIAITCHKSGTVLIDRIFDDYFSRNKLNFGGYYGHNQTTSPDVLHFRFSHFEKFRKTNKFVDFKGITVRRHPYEMIISGYKYHKICKEEWVNHPQKKYDGKSLKEFLNQVTQKEGIAEEIQSARKPFESLYKWDYANDKFLNVKLEDFYDDFDKTTEEISEFLDLNKNLFMKLARKHDINRNSNIRKVNHVTNKTGKKHTYKDFLEEEHYELIRKLYPSDLLEKLGYSA